MHAPNFDFHRDRLPSIVTDEPRALARHEDLIGYLGERNPSEEPTTDFRTLLFTGLRLALKYRWLILATCCVALAIGFVVTFAATPIYRATTVIQINREAPKVVRTNAPADDQMLGDSFRFYSTQYDLLKSRSLAERVAADLDLANKSNFLHPPSTSSWGKLRRLVLPASSNSGGNQGSFDQRKAAAAGMVQGGLTVTPVPQSSLVNISFDSPSPDWAKRIADGVAESYVSQNLERRYGATAYARKFLKERLAELKLKLEESEKALVTYADQKEIIVPNVSSKDGSQPQSLADSDLQALNAALQAATTSRISAQELWRQANASKGLGVPQILKDPSISALRAQRAALMANYQQKLSMFKPAYPDMRKLKAQIDEIDKEIKSEADVIRHSLKARYEAAMQQEELLKEKINETKQGVLKTRSKEIQYNILKREADTNRTLYEGLLQQYKDIGVAGAVSTNNVSIIDRAAVPGGPYKPSLKKNLQISLLLGLIFAGLVIALLEILDDSFKSAEEIEEQLGLAVLGLLPLTHGDVAAEIATTSHSPLAEAFRSFRTAIQFSTAEGMPKSLLVTSAQPSEGKSTTAFALAYNLAQLGMRVLVIDGDLRNPSQHLLLKRDNSVGLSNYLSGAPTSVSIFQETSIKGLYLLPSGPLPPNPAELLAGSKLMSLLTVAREKFDSVIIDGPPILGLADAPLLSSMAGGTLLVVAAGETRRGIVKSALKRLHFARARMIGAVINRFNFSTAGYAYGHGYNYGALEHYGYGQNAQAQLGHSPGP